MSILDRLFGHKEGSTDTHDAFYSSFRPCLKLLKRGDTLTV